MDTSFEGELAKLAGPLKTSEWNGLRRFDFTWDGRNAIIVVPDRPLPQRWCLWRARFFGAFPYLDMELLRRGWYLIHIDIADLYGAPVAVGHWNAFYSLLQQLGFQKKMAIEAMSRGGLIAYNWAKANPEKVACLYVDAPVCDIRSWPAGWGTGQGSREDWERCKRVYGLTDETARTFTGNPVDGLEPLAKAGVPVLHVCGDEDPVVPYTENTALLCTRYQALGGTTAEIIKKRIGHHPHCLENPEPIVRFVEHHTMKHSRA